MKNVRGRCARWLICADGKVVGTDYTCEKSAWRKAGLYAYECTNQDEPYCPVMSVQREEIER